MKHYDYKDGTRYGKMNLPGKGMKGSKDVCSRTAAATLLWFAIPALIIGFSVYALTVFASSFVTLIAR